MLTHNQTLFLIGLAIACIAVLAMSAYLVFTQDTLTAHEIYAAATQRALSGN